MRGPFCRGVKFVFQKSTYKRGEVTTGPRVVPKIIKTGRPEQEGGFDLKSDIPGQGGRGGVKKRQNYRTSFMDSP